MQWIGLTIPKQFKKSNAEDNSDALLAEANYIINNFDEFLVEEEVEAAAAAPVVAPIAATESKAKSVIESTIKESYYSKEAIDKMFENLLSVKENFATQKNNELSALENKIELQNETIKQMFSLLTKMGNEPSAAPTEQTKKAFNVSEFRKSYKEDLQKINNEIN